MGGNVEVAWRILGRKMGRWNACNLRGKNWWGRAGCRAQQIGLLKFIIILLRNPNGQRQSSEIYGIMSDDTSL